MTEVKMSTAASIRGRPGFGFLRLVRFHSGSKVLIAGNIRSSFEESKGSTSTTALAGRKQLSFRGEYFMWQTVLIVRRNVDARAWHLITWSERPSRHNRNFRAGNTRIL